MGGGDKWNKDHKVKQKKMLFIFLPFFTEAMIKGGKGEKEWII